MGRRGFALIANARAGDRDRRPVDVALAALAAHGDAVRFDTEEADDLDAVLDAAGDRVPVVVGGDGSLHAIVERLDRRGELDRPVALVPAGTGNDLARGLGLPLDAGTAALGLDDPRPIDLDLLVDDAGGVAVNAVHAGLGGEAAERAQAWKPRLGAAAYPLGALVAGVRERCWTLKVAVDGRPVADAAEVLMVGMCNGPNIGAGTPLCPPADPADGRLDVVVVRACAPTERAEFAAVLRAGRHLDRDDVVHVAGQAVTVRGDPVRYNADGEVSEPVAERTYRIRPGAWTLLLPRRRDRDRPAGPHQR